jgi:hypothetical protein
MSALDLVAACAVAVATAAAVQLTWRTRTVHAFLAGAAAGAVVIAEPVIWVVAVVTAVAAAVGACFALRTRGHRSDDGRLTAWMARFGASWLVLSFPAVVVWCSVQAAHWMVQRM